MQQDPKQNATTVDDINVKTKDQESDSLPNSKKKWRAYSGIIAASLLICVAVGATLLTKTVYEQKANNHARDILRFIQLSHGVKIQAVVDDETTYIMHGIFSEGKSDGELDIQGVVEYDDADVSYIIRYTNKRAYAEMLNATTKQPIESKCFSPMDMPPLNRLANELLQSKVLNESEALEVKNIIQCGPDAVNLVKLSFHKFYYCLNKKMEGKITQVFGSNVKAELTYLTESEATAMLSKIKHPPTNLECPEIDLDAIYTTQTSATRRLDFTRMSSQFDYDENYDLTDFAQDVHFTEKNEGKELSSIIDFQGSKYSLIRRHLASKLTPYKEKYRFLTCVFVHGAGRFRSTPYKKYWSEGYIPFGCNALTRLYIDTVDRSWFDESLLSETCDGLFKAQRPEDQKRGQKLTNLVIIGHGSGSLTVARALQTKKCQLGKYSYLIAMQPPVQGSFMSKIALDGCPNDLKNKKLKPWKEWNLKTVRGKLFDFITCSTHYNRKFSSAGHFQIKSESRDMFDIVQPFFHKKAFAIMCGFRPGGLLTDNRRAAVILRNKLPDKSKAKTSQASDSFSLWSSCTDGLDTHKFRSVRSFIGTKTSRTNC